MAKVEIIGLDKLQRALRGLPVEVRAPVLRDIARKPAGRAASLARQLFPYGDSGATIRTIGVTKVRDQRQTFVEVGFRGRSLGYIYISGSTIHRRLRGTIKGTPWLFERAGNMLKGSLKKDLNIDLSKVIARYLRRYGYVLN